MEGAKKPKGRPQIHPFTDLHLVSDSNSLVIEKGEGIYLFGSSGAKYLDAMSGLWCATLGYSQQRLTEAAQRQLSILPFSHTFRGRSTPPINQLAQKLIDLSPAQLTSVFFACSEIASTVFTTTSLATSAPNLVPSADNSAVCLIVSPV